MFANELIFSHYFSSISTFVFAHIFFQLVFFHISFYVCCICGCLPKKNSGSRGVQIYLEHHLWCLLLVSLGEDNLKTLYSSSNGCNLRIINGAKMVACHQRIT